MPGSDGKGSATPKAPEQPRRPAQYRGLAAAGYQRRKPEDTVLYQVVQEHLATFLAEARERSPYGTGLPRNVEREFAGYLDCGILARGFARVRCECGNELLVAFSCKRRGICPSCSARRMHETAANLVDRVLPHVPTRQWVLSLPFRVRFLLARRGALRREVLGIFLRAITAWQRRMAGVRRGRGGSSLRSPLPAAFLQRFGSLLNLNVHFHLVALEGVYTRRQADGAAVFHPVRAPTTEEVEAIAARVADRVRGLLERRGLLDEPDADAAALEACQNAALFGAVALGPRAGKKVRRMGTGVVRPRKERPPLCAAVEGFDVHANVALAAENRAGLERLCRYGLRAPFALSRLSRVPRGRLSYELKHPLDDGTTHLLFEPLELLEKLAVLVPPPREHLVAYHGVLAPCASLRAQVVPTEPDPPEACATKRAKPPRRIDWAALLKRVFAVEILACALCGGRMRVIAVIEEGPVATKILDYLDLPSAPPVRAPARDPPEPQLPLSPATGELERHPSAWDSHP